MGSGVSGGLRNDVDTICCGEAFLSTLSMGPVGGSGL